MSQQHQVVWEPGGTEAQTPAGTARRYRKPLLSFRWCDLVALLTDTFAEWQRHKAPRLGAALAFYTALSLAPLLIIAVSVAGLFFGEQAARGQVYWQIQDLIGRQGAQAIQAALQAARQPARSIPATIFGFLTLLFGASAVVAELRGSLNTMWDVPEPETGGMLRRIWTIVKEQFLSFALVLGIGFLLLVSLILNAWLAAIGSIFVGNLAIPEPIAQLVNSILSFVVTIVLFALIYKIIPDLDLEWRDVFLGATVTALLFTLGRVLIGMYLGKAAVVSAYGAAGSIVVVLIWVYYSAQVFFFGAAFTRVFAERYGSQPRLRHAKPLVDASGTPATQQAPEKPRIVGADGNACKPA
jgi:membrane protein